MTWLLADDHGVTLRLHIQPGAKKTKFQWRLTSALSTLSAAAETKTEAAGLHGEALKIRLAAPPVDGKANACLIAFLADRLGVAKAAISLVSGDTSRAKRVRIAGVEPSVVRNRLGGC
ncbi:MAG: DUF167 family protein [Sulfuritalea sp.]|nr:DUF167 family protein [Sulfuritalea sp.]